MRTEEEERSQNKEVKNTMEGRLVVTLTALCATAVLSQGQ